MTRMAVVTMLDNAIASRPDRMCPGGGRGRHGGWADRRPKSPRNRA